MATPVKMPQLGMTMTEAKIVRWLKREGEAVRKGDPIAEIETDKLNAEVEASADGVVRRILAAEGETIPVVGLMAVIGAAEESDAGIEAVVSSGGGAGSVTPLPLGEAGEWPEARGPVPGRRAGEGPATAARIPLGDSPTRHQRSWPGPHPSPLPEGEGTTVAVASSDIKASPIAKRLAADLAVDLTTVQGTGPGGRIVEADVRSAAQSVAAHTAPPEANGHVRASPLARRLARERGIDLHAIRGTGPDGRVVERDVLAAAEARSFRAQQTAPAKDAVLTTAFSAAPAAAVGHLTPREVFKLDGIRRVIAERMHQSLATTAQLTLTTEADATSLVELRSHLVPAAKVYGHRPPSYTDLLVQIVARILHDHPLLNSSLVQRDGTQEIVCWKDVNIGVAVALERGLLGPVIRDAGQKPLQMISQELGDLAERARSNKLSMDELQGGTFTITNLGQQEVDAFTPIINPPQAAILGVGRIAKKAAVHEDEVKVRHMVTLSLSFDHRIVDGAPAGAFLRDVKRAIEAATLGT
ncbi:MAG TPA: 2-oxo acid dehydrogenase subunit E2 [Chloroflexota bacterium]|nr:2-oxo acid dehydrogenase subunit E2 [Chloroflexota bacterium]